MKPDLEAQDAQGYTPLHVAVVSAEKLGSTRNVKSLLLKGANRQAVNKKGKTPKDMTKVLEDQNLASQLVSMLQLQSYCECLMFRVPLVPLKRNHKT